MTSPAVDRAILDTNVLLAATDTGRADHDAAQAILNTWPASGTALYTSGQVLREYLAVSTRPVLRNGLGLDRSDAVANVRTLRTRLHLMAEDSRVHERLLDVLDTVDCTGKQVHDANVVATMLVHGVDTVVTANVDDFGRFADHVRVLDLHA